MKCPRCGFENMPGITQCSSCGTSLEEEISQSSTVNPPRARDRSFFNKLLITRSFVLFSLRRQNTLEHRHTIEKDQLDATGTIKGFLSAMLNIFYVILSIVPGLSIPIFKKSPRICFILFSVAVISITTAFILITSSFFEIFIFLTLFCSYISVVLTLIRVIKYHMPKIHFQIATAFFTMAAFFFVIMCLQIVLQTSNIPISLVKLNVEIPFANISNQDQVLFYKRDPLLKGSLVYYPQEQTAGVVAGVPGEKFPDTTNFKVKDIWMTLDINPKQEYKSYSFIPQDYYLVIAQRSHVDRPIYTVFLARRSDLIGGTTLVLYPIEHRRFLSKINVEAGAPNYASSGPTQASY